MNYVDSARTVHFLSVQYYQDNVSDNLQGCFMTNPKNMRGKTFTVTNGGAVHTYSNDEVILLQIRRATPTEEEILMPSVKVAVSLSPQEALAIASELLLAVSHQIKDASILREAASSGTNQ